jgi:hypothetical protein
MWMSAFQCSPVSRSSGPTWRSRPEIELPESGRESRKAPLEVNLHIHTYIHTYILLLDQSFVHDVILEPYHLKYRSWLFAAMRNPKVSWFPFEKFLHESSSKYQDIVRLQTPFLTLRFMPGHLGARYIAQDPKNATLDRGLPGIAGYSLTIQPPPHWHWDCCEEETSLRSSAWIIAYYRGLLSMSSLIAMTMAFQLVLLRYSFQVSRSLKTMQSINASQGSNHWQQLIDIAFNYNCSPFL